MGSVHVELVDEDADRVAEGRRLLMAAGVYGPRITIRKVASLAKLPITRYFANLIVSEADWLGENPRTADIPVIGARTKR